MNPFGPTNEDRLIIELSAMVHLLVDELSKERAYSSTLLEERNQAGVALAEKCALLRKVGLME